MSLYRIQDALYTKTWGILPSVHLSMVKQLNAHVSGTSFADSDPTADAQAGTPVFVPDNVAVINVDGVIGKHLSLLEAQCGGVDVDAIAFQLKQAAADTNVDSIVMYFNSPGGTVSFVPEISRLISQIDQIKPVYGYTDTQCCSAAYWMASQCRTFYCSPSSQVGSIGCYCLLIDESLALAQEGITVNAISAGDFKLAGASFKPLSQEERAIFQASVDKTFSQFKAAVSANRDIDFDQVKALVFDGDDAVTNNLSDGNLDSIDEMLSLLSNTTSI